MQPSQRPASAPVNGRTKHAGVGSASHRRRAPIPLYEGPPKPLCYGCMEACRQLPELQHRLRISEEARKKSDEMLSALSDPEGLLASLAAARLEVQRSKERERERTREEGSRERQVRAELLNAQVMRTMSDLGHQNCLYSSDSHHFYLNRNLTPTVTLALASLNPNPNPNTNPNTNTNTNTNSKPTS